MMYFNFGVLFAAFLIQLATCICLMRWNRRLRRENAELKAALTKSLKDRMLRCGNDYSAALIKTLADVRAAWAAASNQGNLPGDLILDAEVIE